MSIPIKFRAWDVDSKEFVYISQTEDGEMWVNNGISTTVMPYHKCELEQYTGLKDKNGKEIYEGDIVNIAAVVNTDDSDMTCIMDTNSVVCWDKGHVRWDVNDRPESEDWDYRRRRYFVFVDSDDRENVEVIGNIHENPELLGEEK